MLKDEVQRIQVMETWCVDRIEMEEGRQSDFRDVGNHHELAAWRIQQR
jgi:hypothetical protein